jgi:tetratricopeptide (TPR) repeat protein
MNNKTRKPWRVPVLLGIILLCAGCGTTGAGRGNGLSLEAGIAQIAAEIDQAIPAGTRIVVVNLNTPSARFSDFVLGELQGTLIQRRKLTVVDRKNLESRRNEIDFQMSGEVSDETQVSIGHALGAQSIVTGTFMDMGGSYRFRFEAFDIETTVYQVSTVVTVRHDRTIASLRPSDTSPPPAVVPARPDPELATRYFNAGFAHYEAKEYREAIADFNRALEITKNDLDTLFYRSNSYVEIKDYDSAIAGYTELIRLKPDNVACYNNRGVAYTDKRDIEKAIADFNQAIRLDPNDAMAYNNRGTAYGSKGDIEKAIADFNQALRLDPNYVEAYYNRGVAYGDKGDHDREISDYNEALRLDPNYADAYLNRGIAYNNNREHDEAIVDFNQTLRLNSNHAGAYSNRGLAYVMKGDYAHARADWEQALRLDPNLASARNSLELLRDMGY